MRSVTGVTTGVDASLALRLHEQMCFIRRFETKVDVLYRQGQVRGPAHLGRARRRWPSVSPRCCARRPLDRHLPRPRPRAGPGRAAGRGAERAARPRGRHLRRQGRLDAHHQRRARLLRLVRDRRRAPADRLRDGVGHQDPGDGQVTACFFGDGTTNIGAFHEALNLAAVWQLPVVFVCENNHYMEYTPIADVISVKRPAADRASAYGLAPIVVDGNDVQAVRDGWAPPSTGPRRRRPGADRGRHLPARRALGGRPGHLPQRRRGGEWKQRDPLLRQPAARRPGVRPGGRSRRSTPGWPRRSSGSPPTRWPRRRPTRRPRGPTCGATGAPRWRN